MTINDGNISEGLTGKVLPLVIVVLAVLVVFHNSLSYFFTQDDLVWLRIADNFGDLKGVLSVFTQYNGAGNYRPLTQELFFLANYSLFGLNPVAFHASALLIQVLNALLVYAILQQLFNHRIGSLTGAIFYGANATLFISVYWVSAVSESGMATFFLLCVLFFIHFLKTSQPRYYILAFTAFIAALMSKEAAIAIPPVLLLTYLYLVPGILKGLGRLIAVLSPFVLGVIVYLAIRALSIGMAPEEGPYKPSMDLQLLANLWQYLVWSLNGFQVFEALADLTRIGSRSLYVWLAGSVLLAILVYSALRHGRVLLFSACWFVAALLPVLPFTNHVQNYYVNISTVGISILIAALIAKSGKNAHRFAAAGILVYLLISFANIRYQEQTSWVSRRSELARTALEDIQALHPTLPENAILYLRGTSEDEYWAWNFGDLFRLYYHNNDMATYFEDRHPMPTENGVLYELVWQDGHLKNAEGASARPIGTDQAGGGLGNIIDFTRTPSASMLGDGWNQPESGHRWTTQRAVVYLKGGIPERQANYSLAITGSLTVDYFDNNNVTLTLTANDRVIGRHQFDENGEFAIEIPFEGRFSSPVELQLELDQSFRPSDFDNTSDSRELGISVTRIQLQYH